ncbi:hypothetical protein PsalMR5_02035 [Piscirickettsia salmonis]|nr:hypothetical protein PsalSR1_02071 [Piscirickettsia salmonis]QGP59472.1 hypothetical protein PsalBI1_02060 [Piscirickettsia salmonis]QGP64170.1 hypothetical protein PsalMR5_02035 [Piscirickettsia salmonis]
MHVRNFLQNTIRKLREYENSSPSFLKFLGSDTPELRTARRSYAHDLKVMFEATERDCEAYGENFSLLNRDRLLWFNETGHLGGRLNIMIHRGVYEAEETKQKLP